LHPHCATAIQNSRIKCTSGCTVQAQEKMRGLQHNAHDVPAVYHEAENSSSCGLCIK